MIFGSGIPADMDTLSSRLREARKAKGLSQTELAKAAGVAQSTVGNIESGDRDGASSLAAIAEALGVRYRWLRDGDGTRELPAIGWPFSAALRDRVKALDAEGLRRAENLLRSHFDMDALPRAEDSSGKQPALAA
ncbi:HipB Predicted transcriptional regulators [uncultured Caudovirales phage]|uniref:HipB Predicted transcriptional regulators n=1 Tax=uncultured Caudovirales phage TaxID=2100421 RepID=A0A6J5NJ04_9CAUD|nr:HipB Predicted transcriptional regulators [uncultured Caudovirales phage]